MKRALLTSIVIALLTGCGGATPAGGPPAFEVEPNLIVGSASGRLSVSVWTAPAPPVKGVNGLRLAFSADTGPVAASEVSATVWMPAHGHGTSVKPTFDAAEEGVFEAAHVVFFMDGRWEVRGELKEPPGGAADSFVAAFDVR